MSEQSLSSKEPLISSLRRLGIELDQRLRTAVQFLASGCTTDAHVLQALYMQNSFLTRCFELRPYEIRGYADNSNIYLYPGASTLDTACICDVPKTLDVWNQAVYIARGSGVLGVKEFLSALFALCTKRKYRPNSRPYSMDMFVALTGRAWYSPFAGKAARRVSRISNRLQSASVDDDFQYIITFENDRIVFRVTSILDDYGMSSERFGESGLKVKG